MSKSLETLQATLPVDVQSSILGSVLEEVYVFVIENGKADDLKSFLETSGFKNILSKTQNGLTTVTAEKKQLFPIVSNENAGPDYGSSQCPSSLVEQCDSITNSSDCNGAGQTGTPGECDEGKNVITLCSWSDECGISGMPVNCGSC